MTHNSTVHSKYRY